MRGLIGLLVVTAACSGGTDPATVRSRISTDLGNVLHQSQAASGLAMPGAIALGYVLPAMPAIPDAETALAWTTTVFSDADYLGDDLFRFPAESVCKTDNVVDPACVAAVDKAQLRIRVDAGEALHFYPQLGPDHAEPIDITVKHDGVSITADLDGADSALLAVAAALGAQAPGARLAGQVTFELRVAGTAHVLAALAIDRPVAIALADQGGVLDGDGAVRFTAPVGELASIDLDASARTFAGHFDLGGLGAHLPGHDLAISTATADAAFDGTALALTGVALSASESVDAHVAATIALTQLDATITGANGQETLTPSPRLELASFVDHGLLADAAPAFDVTHLVLDGSVRGDPAMLSVTTGTLFVATSPVEFGFAANAGDCVTADPWALAACN
ncbi:MAG: hypothetical protein ABJE66_33830 [Deltaproteobacteria bacterium]